jgi:acetoin utilization protein AcuC
VHEAGRWPFTGLLTDEGAGAAYNCPVPKGLNDTEFDLILNEVILPFAAAARPEAIFLQCGADAVLEDPLSRLALSNNSHWRTVAALTPMAPRIIVSGGGGYNPWTVGRLWAGVWATLAGHEIPDRLPVSAETIQASLTWPRKGRPTDALLTTLRDAPREGPIRSEIRQAVSHLKSRIAQGVF